MEGLHLTADLSGCKCPGEWMTVDTRLAELCRRATRDAGLTIVGEHWHKFPPHEGAEGGVTGVVLLAESHLAVHTWPELGAVTIDVYACNVEADRSSNAQKLMGRLVEAFQPSRVERRMLRRSIPERVGVAGM